MISILRQEWKARKHTIALVSAALFVFAAIGLPLGTVGADSESQLPFYGLFIALLVISALLTVGCVFFLPLLKGAGNIGNDLLSDRGYLLLSLPKKPVVLFAGKMIIGLAEFLIYAVPVFFYLTFSMPLAGILHPAASKSYGELIRKIYYFLFIEQLNVTVCVFFTAIAFFVFAQTVVNFVVVLYRSFMRTRKASFLMILFTFIAVFVTLKTAERLSDLIIPPVSGDAPVPDILLLLFTGCFLVFSALYFFITILLFERKVEI
ncbi:hypothetical protein H0R92_06455 [Treponema sp. OMZ 840]|uniref:hypothetical protein n=1 Tax=Treponema sp. OMZ 840 TaxID=244313 RepID=UPI003D94C18E